MAPLQLSARQPGHVRVKIRAIGLNRFEALFRRDHYVISPTLTATLGVEAVGSIIETAPDVEGFAVGERVAILPIQSPAVGTGTYATHPDVPVESLVHVADGRSDEEEAATWMASLQAYTLATKVAIEPGDTVIVTAATSSVGTALVQIAHDRGATVIATTRTAARKPELLAPTTRSPPATRTWPVRSTRSPTGGGPRSSTTPPERLEDDACGRYPTGNPHPRVPTVRENVHWQLTIQRQATARIIRICSGDQIRLMFRQSAGAQQRGR
jgi:alcohol dehydrogenase-like protein